MLIHPDAPAPVLAFIEKFLPPLVPSPHDLLFDFDGRHAFVPSAEGLDACLAEYRSALDAVAPAIVVALDASELALAYVARAHQADRALLLRPSASRLAEALKEHLARAAAHLGGRAFNERYDGIKRVRAIIDEIESASSS